VPTSLIYNWRAEIEKFTPQLSFVIVAGAKPERVELIKSIPGHDVAITSYPLIRRDYEEYKGIGFRYCILDEAQYIKNPMSQNALSVKCLTAKCRFALTSTPMENRLLELWSIFDFVLPGYLRTAKEFGKRYSEAMAAMPMLPAAAAVGARQGAKAAGAVRAGRAGSAEYARHADADGALCAGEEACGEEACGEECDADGGGCAADGAGAGRAAEARSAELAAPIGPARPLDAAGFGDPLSELSGQIRPFVLRRLKKDVLNELPDKIDTTMLAEMTMPQKKIYAAYVEKIKRQIASEIAANGFNKSQILILSLLTRLRQICCHPGLFVEGYSDDSGKLLLLQEVVTDAIDGGHRILLFSQFTSMLAIIRKWADRERLSYHYIDGNVKPLERHRLVNEFNEGSGELFLLSLKAGGTGLNLTGADTVIHYDPWWNPAVEEQAADRAYRIGQQKTVQVVKLITAGSIEEKIYSIQERKKRLIDAVIKPGETFLAKMTQEDLNEILAWNGQ
jgi:SNF2 family DNA or RNA helicase